MITRGRSPGGTGRPLLFLAPVALCGLLGLSGAGCVLGGELTGDAGPGADGAAPADGGDHPTPVDGGGGRDLAPEDGGSEPDGGGPADSGGGGPRDGGAGRDAGEPPRPDSGTPADAGGDPTPWVTLLAPLEDEEALNPVRFRFAAGGGVETVRFEAEQAWAMHEEPIPAAAGEFLYRFNGVDRVREITLIGMQAGLDVARDDVRFTPVNPPSSGDLPDEEGFNHYVIAAINDTARYPRDGTYRYCWGADWCGASWGQIHGSRYLDRELYPGGGDCFCSGFSLEIFFDAYLRWQVDQGLDPTVAFGDLDYADARGGIFYQWWQGYDNAPGTDPDIRYSSSAQAFQWAGIGEDISDDLEAATPGDFANISRDTGSGHAILFIGWERDGDEIVGLRYYGCNGNNSESGGGGDSRPDPDDPQNTTSNSGPSFQTEYFVDHGGHVLPRYLFVGHVWDPGTF